MKDLTLAVEQEKSKLSFQKTLLESQGMRIWSVINISYNVKKLDSVTNLNVIDELKELLSRTEMELKSELHNEESGVNAVSKLTTFLPSLDENLEKCNDSNVK